MSPAMHKPAIDRLLPRLDITSPAGCWEWTGATVGEYGHGYIHDIGRRMALTHRVAYEALVGPIPDGLTLDHLCRNPICANPLHLEPVTMRVNVLRSASPSALQALQTHCKNGHPLSGDNLVTRQGRRNCRTCLHAYAKRRWQAKKAERAAVAA